MIYICIAVKNKVEARKYLCSGNKKKYALSSFPADMLAQGKQKGPYDSTLFIPSLTLYTSRCKKTR